MHRRGIRAQNHQQYELFSLFVLFGVKPLLGAAASELGGVDRVSMGANMAMVTRPSAELARDSTCDLSGAHCCLD